MTTLFLKKKKEKIKKILEEKYTETNIIIYFLLINHKLDNIIASLDDVIVIPEIANTIKKGYLTSEEQFVEMLKYIIDTFNNEFWFIRSNRNIILDCLINSKEAREILYSKKYLGDNQYIDYFFGLFQKMMVHSFQKIIIDSTIDMDMFLRESHLDSLRDEKKLYAVLKLICLCNCTSYQLIYLFDSNLDKRNKHFYTMQLEIILDRTYRLKNEALGFMENCYF